MEISDIWCEKYRPSTLDARNYRVDFSKVRNIGSKFP